MAEQTVQQKEKYSGVYTGPKDFNGKTIRFNRVWSSHRFTDEECRALLRGEEISIHGCIARKTGKPFSVKGVLSKLTGTDRESGKPYFYYGFERTGFADRGIPEVFCQHKFTDDERTLMEQGKAVQIDDLVSKKGNTFSAKVSYGTKEDGSKGLILDFT